MSNKHNHSGHHDHHDHHHHHHHHHDAAKLTGKKLLLVTLLNFSITVVQIIGGIISNSLSLLSDALHNLGDSSAIFIAFLAGKRSQKKPDFKKTYGYKRIEILAALFNAVVLIGICVYLFFEAYHRFKNPSPIKGKLMLFVAIFGLLINVISVFILQKDKGTNLNVKAAYLHLLGDTLSSVAVIFGGIAIVIWKIYWIDPLITVLVGIYIIKHTWGIVQESVDILMQGVPHEIELTEIKKEVEQIDKINNIHHVHVWKLDDQKIFLEAHVDVKEDVSLSEAGKILAQIENVLKDKFNISHVTIQFGYNCCNGEDDLLAFNKE